MKRALVLEDEPAISEFVEINLIRAGYDVLTAGTGEEALELVEQNDDITVALLDVMLPGIDGFEVCRRIREMGRSFGIIMLSARSQEMDKVTGLMIGADDYVPKPFSPTELILRVDALARRVERRPDVEIKPMAEAIYSGDFRLDIRSRILYKRGEPVDLTQVEYVIVRYLFENRNKALSRDDILNSVWGNDYTGEPKIVDVNVRRLRLKLEDDPGEPVHLVSVRGFGYKWID
ncbi:MAG: response regulator transcription factor [Kiritimatiellae bacterium]|nr:response regulator transcription factor [Kiritimatiellia bacterium]